MSPSQPQTGQEAGKRDREQSCEEAQRPMHGEAGLLAPFGHDTGSIVAASLSPAPVRLTVLPTIHS